MPTLITSVHNPRIRQAVQLRRHKHREKAGRIIIDGLREVRRAVAAAVRIVELFVCQGSPHQPECTALTEELVRHGVPVTLVAPHVFAKLAYGQRNDGVVAVAETPPCALGNISLPQNPVVAVLEAVEKPGNLGAVVRCADAAGLAAVVAADGRCDLWHPNVIRASLGTAFTIPLAAAGAEEVRGWLQQQRLQVFAARPDAELLYTQVDFRSPCAIVLGSEAAGLSSHWSVAGVTPIGLPMLGVADSLNVSAAAAVLFYEAWRQRQQPGEPRDHA